MWPSSFVLLCTLALAGGRRVPREVPTPAPTPYVSPDMTNMEQVYYFLCLQADVIKPGEVCMFHAPAGAFGLGHAGWAYKAIADNTWYFGSTEDLGGELWVTVGLPAADWSWWRHGTEAQVRDTFKNRLVINGKEYHSAGYYTEYRCKTTKVAHLADAFEGLRYAMGSGYDVNFDNCLTKSIYVFMKYDPGLGLEDGHDTGPTSYFNSKLTGFGPVYAV